MNRALVVVAALAAAGAPARANVACNNNVGWAIPEGTTVPPHPRLLMLGELEPGITPYAKIDGKTVPVKMTGFGSRASTSPLTLTVFEVDSDKVGALELGWEVSPGYPTTFKYRIAKVATPKTVGVKTSHFHRELRHSTVREVYDGLALALDTPLAIAAHVKIRRDDKAAWSELDVPITHDFDDATPLVRLGRLGCVTNYSVDLLKSGVDLDVTITLVDGSTRHLDLTHAQI